jgi:hypothetical protein
MQRRLDSNLSVLGLIEHPLAAYQCRAASSVFLDPRRSDDFAVLIDAGHQFASGAFNRSRLLEKWTLPH